MQTHTLPEGAQTTYQPDPRRWLMLAITLGAAFMATLDGFIVNVAVPSIERELQASFAEIQLVVAGYMLAFAVLLVTGGRLGDLYGRKRLFLLGVGGFTLFSALCGFAPSPVWLIIFRVAKGAAAALMTPQVLSFISVTFDSRERPIAFGLYAAASGLASILGQVFGGALLAFNLFDLGWRIIFLVNVPIGVLVLLLAIPLIRESRLEHARSLDSGGVALLSVALFLLVFPLVEGASAGWPWWALACLALAVPFLLLFIAYEQRLTTRGETPLVSLALFRLPRFRAGVITSLLSSTLFSSLMFLLPFYLQTILQLTPLQSGLVFMAASISFILASSLSPFIDLRLGKATLPIAALLVTLGYLLVMLAAQWLVLLWGIVPVGVALFTIGLGMGLLSTPLMSKALEDVPQLEAGAASGIYTTGSQVAGAFGVAIIGLLFGVLTANSGDPLRAFVVSMLVMALLSLGLLVCVRPFNKEGQTSSTISQGGQVIPAGEHAQSQS